MNWIVELEWARPVHLAEAQSRLGISPHSVVIPFEYLQKIFISLSRPYFGVLDVK